MFPNMDNNINLGINVPILDFGTIELFCRWLVAAFCYTPMNVRRRWGEGEEDAKILRECAGTSYCLMHNSEFLALMSSSAFPW